LERRELAEDNGFYGRMQIAGMSTSLELCIALVEIFLSFFFIENEFIPSKDKPIAWRLFFGVLACFLGSVPVAGYQVSLICALSVPFVSLLG
jgi:hypothetical protein